MKTKRITRFLLLLLSLCLLAGCGTSTREIDLQALAASAQESAVPTQDPRPFLDEFIALLNENDFGSCYAMLAPDTQEAVALVDFSDRYESIFSAIELTSLGVAYGDLTMDGKRYMQAATLTYDSPLLGVFTQEVVFSLNYSEDTGDFTLNWTPAMIFEGLTSSNVVRLRTLEPKRGEILDSGHNAYAINSYAESVYVQPSKIEDESYTVAALASILSMEVSDVADILHSENAQKYDSAVVKAYPPGGISSATESALTTLPGVGVDRTSMTPIRYYPQGAFFAHAMGYTSAITAEELETLDPERYGLSSYVGRTGLEAAYEDTLCGTKGYSLDIYASDGQWLSTVARKDAVDGLDLEITLDYDLQSRAEEIMDTMSVDNLAGAAVVLDPKTGDVLAMASYPDFDPNLFVLNSDPVTLASYVSEESNSPLYNRAVQGSYIPGSTIKPLIAAMSLEYDILNENYEFTGDIYKNQWTPSGYWPYPAITRVSYYNGPVNMSNALTYSDNIYFAFLALQTGWDILEPFLQRIGFDERIDFDLRVSQPSYLSSGNYENRQLLAATGYGQGELLVSPLQMACIFSSLANDGDIMTPRLVKATRRMEGTEYVTVDEFSPTVWREDVITEDALETIVPMLHRVVEEGTGRRADIDGLTIYGKTGTAEIGSDKTREIGWFIAFVDDDEYSRLVCVTLELPANYEGTIRYDLARELLMP
ncbi:MAG: penicillin-binding transpeptidase domain-containing protein [Candidatus Spyradocola sp.]|jgi:cell division protein FtsI/penicillin-binding protein 2